MFFSPSFVISRPSLSFFCCEALIYSVSSRPQPIRQRKVSSNQNLSLFCYCSWASRPLKLSLSPTKEINEVSKLHKVTRFCFSLHRSFTQPPPTGHHLSQKSTDKTSFLLPQPNTFPKPPVYSSHLCFFLSFFSQGQLLQTYLVMASTFLQAKALPFHNLYITKPTPSFSLPVAFLKMKFEDYLAEQADEKHHQQRRRNILEEEVENLHAELDEQQAIGKVLQSALHGPVLPPHPCIASLLPPQVQGLIAEMAIVEEEIVWLERRVNNLKLGLYYERKLTKKQQRRQKSKQQSRLPVCEEVGASRSVLVGDLYQVSRSQRHGGFRKEKFKFRRASAGSAEEVLSSVLPTTGPSPSKPKKPHRARAPVMQKESVPYLVHRDIMLQETRKGSNKISLL